MNNIKTIIGVDIAKRVFQLHEVSKETGEIVSLQLKRAQFLAHFTNRSACLIGMEACGGSQHWARRLTALGHTVKLMTGKQVKPLFTAIKMTWPMHGRFASRCSSRTSKRWP